MERAPAANAHGWSRPSFAALVGQWLPAVLFAAAAFLIARGFAADGSASPPSSTVDRAHGARLAENIRFFEDRVVETRDSLSYNRLTQLYLQRLRETGDVADVRRAELSATRSLGAAPGDYTGLILLAQVRVAQHEFEAAEALALQARTAKPDRPDALAVLGDAHMAMGRYGAAADEYRQYLEKAPGSSAFSRRALLAEAEGQVPLAEQFWHAAIDADRAESPESSAWARVQLANLLFTTGRLDAAQAEYRRALDVFPGYGAATAGLGRVAAARGHDAQAIELYTKAVASLPLPEYAAAITAIATRSGKPELAARQRSLMGAYGQLFEANGVRDDLILILFDADHGADPTATLGHAAQAYARRPSLAAADTYAWALYHAGRLPEARAKAEEALRLGTQEPLYLYHAGAIAFAQGDLAAAQGYLERALGLNPHFAPLHDREAADLLRRAREHVR